MDLADPIRCRGANHPNLTLDAIAKRGGLETLILQRRFQPGTSFQRTGHRSSMCTPAQAGFGHRPKVAGTRVTGGEQHLTPCRRPHLWLKERSKTLTKTATNCS